MGEGLGSIPSIGRGAEIQNLAAEKKKLNSRGKKKNYKSEQVLLWEKKKWV